MRLSWKDGITTALLLVALLVVQAVIQGWGWPLLGSYRTGVLALGILGISMCTIGAQINEGSFGKSPYTILASLLGGGALVLIVVGLVIGSRAVFLAVASDILVLWAMATVRHAIRMKPMVPAG